jgi:hypothetical protein
MLAAAAAGVALCLTTPQSLDLLFAVSSLALFALYHVWYYSWHLWEEGRALGAYHRLDRTGQVARDWFTQVCVCVGGGGVASPGAPSLGGQARRERRWPTRGRLLCLCPPPPAGSAGQRQRPRLQPGGADDAVSQAAVHGCH